MASMTGSAPPIAVSGAAAATTRNTMPITPMEPRRLRPPPSASAGVSVTGWGRERSLMAGTAPGRAAGRARRAVGAGVGRDVERGVALEEADRLELEAGAVDGHDRPVLGTGHVGQAEGVPDHDVGPDEVAVGRDVLGEPRAALVLVDEVARRVPLRRVVGGDPQVLGGEGGPAVDRAVRVGQQRRLALRQEGVGNRLAEPVAALRVADVPDP